MHPIEKEVEETLKKVPQMTRLKRHLRTLITHSTPRKLLNLAKVEWQRKRGRIRVSGRPYIIIIDPMNLCNLNCPLCPTGLGEKGTTRTRIKFEEFKRIVNQFAPWAYEVSLHNWGEPFLNKEILSMIQYCQARNIGTNLSSNLNILPFSGEDLVKSGLEYLIVSMDGVSQPVYETYRKNGNVEKVKAHIREIVLARKKLGRRTPVIEWQYIIMKHNLHEVGRAENMAQELGVDLLRFIPVGLPFDVGDKKSLMEEWYPYIPSGSDGDFIDDRFLQEPIHGGCFYIYRSATITSSGKVAPCCAVWKDRDTFGDLKKDPFERIWNDRAFKDARSLFSKMHPSAAQAPPCCRACPLFKQY